MNELLKQLSETDNLFYAVLNPEDNSVLDMSKSLKSMTGEINYQNKQLREIIGCFMDHECSGSAVQLDMGSRDKVLHIVDCQSLGQQFIVLKFKSFYNGNPAHTMIFTETDCFTSNANILNNMDSIFSHEIQNIVNNMKLVNMALSQELSSPEHRDLSELLKISDRSIDVMENVLKLYKEIKANVLNTSYCTSDKVEICDIVANSVKEQTALLKQKKLRVVTETDSPECPECCTGVNLNKGLLSLLFSNLINNAFKYSPDNSDIQISFKHHDTFIKTTIQNSGTLPTELASNFFSKYMKGEDSVGTGFGTYCSKLITELFKGEIEMHNENETVKVSVKLPTNL